MRLQLATVASALLVCSPALAQEEANSLGTGEATSRVAIYSDDDATSVITSTVDAQALAPGNITIGAHALVDVVSSASIDVVSAATERWEETRVEVGARGRATMATVGLSLGYTRSQENDWLSHAVFAGAFKELFEKNTLVSASYGLTVNTVGRASDPNFKRSIDSHSGELGVSQLIDEKTRVGGAYTLQFLSGYLSSPYRFVSAADGSRVPERHPDSRMRHAVSGFVQRSLARTLAGRLGYRFYTDDWGIRSHTATLRFAVEISQDWLAGLEGRAYLQDQADFYQGVYATSFRHMSFDRELSSFWDAGGSADVAATLGPVTADAKVGLIYYKFDNFPALKKRTAIVASAGAKLEW